MKVKSVVFALLMVTVSVAAFAADPVSPKMVVVTQKDPGSFKVIYEGTKVEKLTFKIINKEGNKVAVETIYGVDGFMRVVNFAGMNAGEYTIEVIGADSKQAQKINYQPVVAESAAIHIAKLADAGKYLLVVSNTKEVNVKIYDGSDRLVHDQNVVAHGSTGLVFDLNKVAGSPRFEVSSSTGTKVVRY